MPSDHPHKRLRIGDVDRDRVLNVLHEAHGAGRLTFDELNERQDRALAARYADEFAALIDDLPEGQELVATSPAMPVAAGRGSASQPVPYNESLPAITFMSGKEVVVAPGTSTFKNFALWGGDTIDLSHAMGPGVVVTLDLTAIMAGHTILVPEGVLVRDESVAVMAGNDVKREARGDGSNGTLILRGFLFWGGSYVKLAT
ncbi:DUF1707 SHOCT-like domain-containing protein [Nigerium massiliense]|uniref:DUF1707 SHOCT-like domain-containing protein n=1 Tax=Nigerium massiliense TaxID=1522317 RepID=UPI0005913E8B|nr:DUF1707 domain-containing protein [Nigerium massiliense]